MALRVAVSPHANIDSTAHLASTRHVTATVPFSFYDVSAAAAPALLAAPSLGIDVSRFVGDEESPALELEGLHLSPVPGAMRVGFGAAGAASATFVATGRLLVTPPLSAQLQTVPLWLSVEAPTGTVHALAHDLPWAGEERAMPLTATYFDSRVPADVARLSPAAGDLHARTALAVTGANFAPAGDGLVCAVGGALSPAAFVDGHHLSCAAPPLPSEDRTPRTVRLAASNDGGATLGATRPSNPNPNPNPNPSTTPISNPNP